MPIEGVAASSAISQVRGLIARCNYSRIPDPPLTHRFSPVRDSGVAFCLFRGTWRNVAGRYQEQPKVEEIDLEAAKGNFAYGISQRSSSMIPSAAVRVA